MANTAHGIPDETTPLIVMTAIGYFLYLSTSNSLWILTSWQGFLVDFLLLATLHQTEMFLELSMVMPRSLS